jgi:hypothetical protein
MLNIMARTRKLRLKGGQGVGDKRKREEEDSAAPAAKRPRTEKVEIDSCGDPVSQSWMALHLKADIKHDHSIEASDDILGPVPPINSLAEDPISKYIQSNFPAKQKDLRKDDYKIKIAQKTDFFSQDGVSPMFVPFNGVSNDKVGVVQDAGFILYDAIGAVNLLTFGSVLDQAGKPKTNAYYQESDKTLSIPLCKFGFNKNLGDITISNFKGDSVEYNFGNSGGRVVLNKLSGDFKSVEQVAGITDQNAKKRSIIGKALGDALQVASLDRSIANELYPISVKSLTGSDIRGIEKVLFNTGDRLAHIRAYMFGVPSMYSSPADKNGIREFTYIMGVDVDVDLDKYYLDAIDKICINIDETYNQLLNHLQEEVLQNIINYSKYDNEPLIMNQSSINRSKEYINRLISNITTIHKIVKEYCEEIRSSVEEDLKQPIQKYNRLLIDSLYLTPSSTSTMKRGGKSVLLTLTILKPRIQIKGKTNTLEPNTYTWNIYETYKNIGEGKKIDEKHMKVFTIFGNEPPLPNGPAIGGGDEKEVFGIPFTGQTVVVDLKDRAEKEPDSEFLNQSYLPQASGMTWKEVYEAYETYNLNSSSILDEMLFESLFNEYASISGEDATFTSNTDTVKKGAHSVQSLKFNAFACRFNATIAGEDTDFGKELLEYAATFEKLINTKPDAGPITPQRPLPPPVSATLSTVGIATQEQMPIDEDDDGNNTGTESSNVEGKTEVGKKLFGFGRGSGLDIEHSFVNKIGGQRVDRENFSIDETKSFVKTGGYPSSNVK